MTFCSQTDYTVRCEWGFPGVEYLAAADVIIIVDVLSFSTCVDIAVSRGATVLPYRWKDETAIAYAREQNAELASPRNRFVGRYSLAPSSLVNVPAGLRLVLPSPNGSALAFQARDAGAKVVMGCLRNAPAVARWANTMGGTINVIPAGERWPDGSLRCAIEDLLGAGAIISQLQGAFSPEAKITCAAWTALEPKVTDTLLHSASGRELVQKSFKTDVELAAMHDVSTTVPLLKEVGFMNANPASS